MKTNKRLFILLVALLCGVGIALFVRSRSKPSNTGVATVDSGTIPGNPATPGQGAIGTMETDLDESPLNWTMLQAKPEDVENFVARRGREISALMGAFELTGDDRWLEELKRRDDLNPAALATLAMNLRDPEEALQYAIQLQEMDPNNGAGVMLEYLAKKRLGTAFDIEDENSFFSRIVAAGTLSLGETTRRIGLRDALRELGEDDIKANWFSQSPLRGYITTLNELAKSWHRFDRRDGDSLLEGPGGDNQASQSLGVELGRLVGTLSGSIASEIIGRTIQIGALRELGDDVEVDNNGTTARQMAERLYAEINPGGEIDNANEAARRILPKLTNAELTTFMERVESQGALAAQKWLLTLDY